MINRSWFVLSAHAVERGVKPFPGFRIVRLPGSGGMGEVYLAEHPRLTRCDALKALPAGVSAIPNTAPG